MDDQAELDPRLQQRLRASLERAANDIDPVSAARLRSARLRATATAETFRPTRWRWLAASAPAAAVVALAVLVVDAPWNPSTPPVAAAPSEAVRDLDLLTSGENLELLEDLEFFRWLPAERSS